MHMVFRSTAALALRECEFDECLDATQQARKALGR
jgi:hypothetical protein